MVNSNFEINAEIKDIHRQNRSAFLETSMEERLPSCRTAHQLQLPVAGQRKRTNSKQTDRQYY